MCLSITETRIWTCFPDRSSRNENLHSFKIRLDTFMKGIWWWSKQGNAFNDSGSPFWCGVAMFSIVLYKASWQSRKSRSLTCSWSPVIIICIISHRYAVAYSNYLGCVIYISVGRNSANCFQLWFKI